MRDLVDGKKFTVDDAANLFGEDEPEEETKLDPEPELEFEMKALDSRVEKDPKLDDAIVNIRERALEIIGKCENIYKLTLQGRLETEFPLIDKRTIRKAINSLKDHPGVKWPHNLLLQKR